MTKIQTALHVLQNEWSWPTTWMYQSELLGYWQHFSISMHIISLLFLIEFFAHAQTHTNICARQYMCSNMPQCKSAAACLFISSWSWVEWIEHLMHTAKISTYISIQYNLKQTRPLNSFPINQHPSSNYMFSTEFSHAQQQAYCF